MTRVLNLFCCIAFILLLASGLRTGRSARVPVSLEGMLPAASSPSDELPDIYYIILDSYGRHDVLLELYDLDTSPFLDFLRERGFYVASQSYANYAQTELSLASSLNLTYLDELISTVGTETTSPWPPVRMMQRNALFAMLRSQGYAIRVLSCGLGGTNLIQRGVVQVKHGGAMSQFESIYLDTTLFGPFVNRLRGNPIDRYEAQRQQTRFILDQVTTAGSGRTPLFVLAHLLCPHPPFVFGAGGEPVRHERDFTVQDGAMYFAEGEYREKYRDQVIYLNTLLRQTVTDILATSGPETVIVLQGDHGPASMVDMQHGTDTNLKERLAILNAYRLPGGGTRLLHERISPVNTFRVILSHYFGATFDLLPDRSYFSTWARPYALQPVGGEALGGAPSDQAESEALFGANP